MNKDDKEGYAFNPKMSRRSVLTGGASTAARVAVRGGIEEEAPSFAAKYTSEEEGVEKILGHHKTQEKAIAQINRHAKKQGWELRQHASNIGKESNELLFHPTHEGPNDLYDYYQVHREKPV